MPESRIDIVKATYHRSGKCKRCGGSTERSKTFSGHSLADCNRQAAAWEATPLLHKRCEGFE